MIHRKASVAARVSGDLSAFTFWNATGCASACAPHANATPNAAKVDSRSPHLRVTRAVPKMPSPFEFILFV
jgi:hypothetical protein